MSEDRVLSRGELLDGELVYITDENNSMFGFVGEAQLLESGHELLIWIDERRSVTVGIDDVQLFLVK